MSEKFRPTPEELEIVVTDIEGLSTFPAHGECYVVTVPNHQILGLTPARKQQLLASLQSSHFPAVESVRELVGWKSAEPRRWNIIYEKKLKARH